MSSFDSMGPLDSAIDFQPHLNSQVDLQPLETSAQEKLVVVNCSAKEPSLTRLSLMERLFRNKRSRPTPTVSQFSPWLISLAYPLGRHLLVPFYFSHIELTGRENLPLSGPVILAPTHRSRWDAILVPYAAGHDITGRHLRFMVSADEVVGIQGWLIRRMGGFPIDTTRPAIATLRHGVELLQHGETMVIFPEGNIFRGDEVNRLKPGLARLALQAEASHENLGVKIVPISLQYSHPFVPWRSRVKIQIGQPLVVSEYALGSPKQNAQRLTADLFEALKRLMGSGEKTAVTQA